MMAWENQLELFKDKRMKNDVSRNKNVTSAALMSC